MGLCGNINRILWWFTGIEIEPTRIMGSNPLGLPDTVRKQPQRIKVDGLQRGPRLKSREKSFTKNLITSLKTHMEPDRVSRFGKSVSHQIPAVFLSNLAELTPFFMEDFPLPSASQFFLTPFQILKTTYKLPLLIGKSSINWPLSIDMSNYQRLFPIKIYLFLVTSQSESSSDPMKIITWLNPCESS